MKVAVASGKGGTGKTTIAASLTLALADQGVEITCLDCDVEAPNAHIFLQPELDQNRAVTLQIPQVDTDLCTGGGRCAEVCEFNAIIVFGSNPLVFPQLCHGCGSCTLVCPENAISETPRLLGLLESGPAGKGVQFAHGVLNVGEPLAVPVISQLKKWAAPAASAITIVDSPPGSSCPVVESLRGADYVILVTEPTPFGLHDLKLAVKLTQELDLPAGVILNRDGIGDDGVEKYCQVDGLPILMRIPFERQIGEGIAQGKTLVEIHPEYLQRFQKLYQMLLTLIPADQGKS